MRRSAQFLVETGRKRLDEGHIESALDEMLFSGGSLNAKLLGFSRPDETRQHELRISFTELGGREFHAATIDPLTSGSCLCARNEPRVYIPLLPPTSKAYFKPETYLKRGNSR